MLSRGCEGMSEAVVVNHFLYACVMIMVTQHVVPVFQLGVAVIRHLAYILEDDYSLSRFHHEFKRPLKRLGVLYILWLFRHADSICLSAFCKVPSRSWPLLIRTLVISALKSPLLGDFLRMAIYCKSSRETFQQDWRPSLCILVILFTRSPSLNGVPVCQSACRTYG